jgi:hypothetical protein
MDIDPDRPLGQDDKPKDLFATDLVALRSQGFVPYSAGPVYYIGRAKESVAGRFCRETGRKAQGGEIDLAFQFVDPDVVGPVWCRRINFMDEENWPHFIQWMMHVDIVSREDKFYYVMRRYSAPVVDPLARASGRTVPGFIDVISVSGLSYDLHPVGVTSETEQKNAPLMITFERRPPEPIVVRDGKKILGIIDEL